MLVLLGRSDVVMFAACGCDAVEDATLEHGLSRVGTRLYIGPHLQFLA